MIRGAKPISFCPTTTLPWAGRDRCLASWGLGEEADKCLLGLLCGPVKQLGVNVCASVCGCGSVIGGVQTNKYLIKELLVELLGPVRVNKSEYVGKVTLMKI